MQLVNEKYYIWYNYIATALGAIMVVVTGVSFALPAYGNLHTGWGFVPIVAILGSGQLIYGLLFFNRLEKWLAGMLAAMLLTLSLTAVVHNSGQLHSWFVAAWLVQILASGMFGLYTVIGTSFLVTLYYILTATGVYGRKLIDPRALGVVAGAYIAGVVSYLIWKRMYMAAENQKISQLTGQLKSKQQQAEMLIQSISDGMIVTDTDGRISLLNPAAAIMTEWTVDEALGIDVALVAKFAQEDGKELPASEDPFKKALSTNQKIDCTLQLLGRTSKTPRVVSIVISPILMPKTDEPAGMVAVIRDVSAAREEEHRRADFISTASHEMRTPVAAIEGYLQLALNEKVARIDAKARDYLVKALDSSHHLGTLFQDLLTSAKAEDGRLVSHPRVVEMGQYLQGITDGLRFAAEKKGMLVDFTVGSDSQTSTGSAAGTKVIKPLYYAHLDPDRMQEVVTNLFDNAVKYSEKGKITVGLTGNNDVIQFFIRDTGHGIPPDDVPHLFQKFYRVDNSSTRTIGGTGLGLFICRKIVELYKGRIWVESEVGKGSTFYINVPRLTSQKAAELQAAESQQLV